MDSQKDVEIILNKMFEISGSRTSYREIIHREDNWFLEFEITEDQHKEWIKWGKSYLKKKVTRPEVTMALIDATWGLKIIS